MDEYQKRMVQTASRFCMAIFAAPNRNARPSDLTVNGSATLVELPSGKVLLTALHVWDGLREYKQKNPSAVLAAQTRSGGRSLTLGPLKLVGANQQLDIAAVVTTRSNHIESDGKFFFKPKTWPPEPPLRGDWILIYGFPAAQRVPKTEDITFYGVAIIGRVSSISELRFILAAEDEPRILERTAEDVPDLSVLGGMSGSPAFKLTSDGLSLVGILCQTLEGRADSIMCSRVDYVTETGTLDSSRLPPS